MVIFELTDPSGVVHTLKAATGKTLMRAAFDAQVPGIEADCGGCLTCATCHVYLDEAVAAKLQADGKGVSDEEESMLAFASAPRKPTSRLSCQVVLSPMLNGGSATVAPTQY
jgi:ferredoxin, 2Fe-2S